MKEVIERCNWLVNKCEDKAITPDVKDDVRYLLEEIERLKEMKLHTEKYASEMEDKYILEKNKNNKAIEFLDNECLYDEDLGYCDDLWCGQVQELVDILKGVDEK